MSLKLPNDKIVYNLPEQVGVNAENIKYLAEVYKEIDSIPAQYAELKADYDDNIKAYFDDTMKPTFTTWTNTFNGWTNTLDTYLANMSSAAVGAIAGETIAPANVAATGNITAPSIIESMAGYSYANGIIKYITPVYAGTVKNGNKITFAIVGTINIPTGQSYSEYSDLGTIYMIVPPAIYNNIYPIGISAQPGAFDIKLIGAFKNFNEKININVLVSKSSAYGGSIAFHFYGTNDTPANDVDYGFRTELTLLLGTNFVS